MNDTKPKPCPFCGDAMTIEHGVVKHMEQGTCIIGQHAWDESYLSRWNERGGGAPITRAPKKAGTTKYP